MTKSRFGYGVVMDRSHKKVNKNGLQGDGMRRSTQERREGSVGVKIVREGVFTLLGGLLRSQVLPGLHQVLSLLARWKSRLLGGNLGIRNFSHEHHC